MPKIKKMFSAPWFRLTGIALGKVGAIPEQVGLSSEKGWGAGQSGLGRNPAVPPKGYVFLGCPLAF